MFRHVSALQKLLLALLLVMSLGNLRGRGTFASFTATLTHGGATFSTGTLVLTDTVGSGDTCFSTGTGPTDSGTTDVNANGGCAAVFAVAGAVPGATASAEVTIENAGTVAAAALVVHATGCTPADSTVGAYHGVGDPCDVLQLTLDAGSECRYGRGASGVVSGAAIAFPLTVNNNTNDKFRLNVDGAGLSANLDLVATTTVFPATAAGRATLEDAVNTAIGSIPATAAIGPDDVLYISSDGSGSGSSIAWAGGSTDSAQTKLAMASPTTTAGGQADCLYDPIHTVEHFAATHPNLASGIGLGALPVGTPATYSFGVHLPTATNNDYQGRVATFGFTWSATQ